MIDPQTTAEALGHGWLYIVGAIAVAWTAYAVEAWWSK